MYFGVHTVENEIKKTLYTYNILKYIYYNK